MLNKSHKTIYECILLFFKKNNQICFNDDKKLILTYKKFRSVFMCKKNGFWRENSDLSLLIKHKVFWFVKKIHICFLRDNKNGFLCNRKIRSVSIFEKDIFLWRGSHSQNNIMLHDSNKTTTHNLFLYFKNLQVLKIISVSKEDTKSVLYFKKNSDLRLKKCRSMFIFVKNLDLHLRKM